MCDYLQGYGPVELFAVPRHQLAEGDLFGRYAFICCDRSRRSNCQPARNS